ncbi:MAG TPA: phosphate acetyltransferase, partial [Bacteroidales bacterium]|nr:phosphate acetyltransferase [Bacteroidales bacterium]
MQFIDSIKEKARMAGKTIVLPEGTEERTLKAADIILQEGLAKLILLGPKAEIEMMADSFGLKNIKRATIIDPETWERRGFFAEMLTEIRKSKGITYDEAYQLVANP